MEILDKEDLSEIVAWLPHGKAFILVNKRRFAKEVLGDYFKRSKFSSFTRKLNRWGFQRVTRGPDTGAYFHPLFQRNNLRLCLQMTSNGTKATKEQYPGPLLNEAAGVHEVAPQRTSDEVRPDATMWAFRGRASSSHRRSQIKSVTASRQQGKNGGKSNCEGKSKTKPAPCYQDLVESNDQPSLSLSGFESSAHPVDDLILHLKKDFAATRRCDVGPLPFDLVRGGSLPTPSSAVYRREAALASLRLMEARSRVNGIVQPAYLSALSDPSLDFLTSMGSSGVPYSLHALAYLTHLQKLEEARALPPQLQFQLAHASLAATASANPFATSLLPPFHLHAAAPMVPFQLSAERQYRPDAAGRTTNAPYLTTWAPDHCFFPSVQSSSASNSKSKKEA